MVALPFCQFELRAARRKLAGYHKQINSLDEHIHARRLDLKIPQKQVANQIGVHEQTIAGRESNATVPEVRYMPAHHSFNPSPQPARFLNILLQRAGRLASRSGRWPRSLESIRRR